MAILNHCCYCVSLRKGCLIIGVILLFVNLVNILFIATSPKEFRHSPQHPEFYLSNSKDYPATRSRVRYPNESVITVGPTDKYLNADDNNLTTVNGNTTNDKYRYKSVNGTPEIPLELTYTNLTYFGTEYENQKIHSDARPEHSRRINSTDNGPEHRRKISTIGIEPEHRRLINSSVVEPEHESQMNPIVFEPEHDIQMDVADGGSEPVNRLKRSTNGSATLPLDYILSPPRRFWILLYTSCTLETIGSICLVIGASKNIPWLVLVFVLLEITATIIKTANHDMILSQMFIPYIIIAFAHVYCIIIGFSFYEQLKDSKDVVRRQNMHGEPMRYGYGTHGYGYRHPIGIIFIQRRFPLLPLTYKPVRKGDDMQTISSDYSDDQSSYTMYNSSLRSGLSLSAGTLPTSVSKDSANDMRQLLKDTSESEPKVSGQTQNKINFPTNSDKKPNDVSGNEQSNASGTSSNATGAPSNETGAPSNANDASSNATGAPSNATGAPSNATDTPSNATGVPSNLNGTPNTNTNNTAANKSNDNEVQKDINQNKE